jgi:hypothetical protein
MTTAGIVVLKNNVSRGTLVAAVGIALEVAIVAWGAIVSRRYFKRVEGGAPRVVA